MGAPDNTADDLLRFASQPKKSEDSPPMLESAGPAVVGNYVKRRKLGEGGFGEVWLADDTRLSRPVALKFLKDDARADLARFRREATLASSLSHPNIAAVYEISEAPPFIAMQYIEGQSADKLSFTPREAARIVKAVAEAVHAAHQRGIVHRDLKPSNIMIDLKGTPYVMDFGLAKRTDVESSLSQSGIIMGTPSFMSPEQAEGHVHLDGRSDVFSLGSTLYALLAGVPPFMGETMDVLRKVLEAEPEPLPGVPKDLRTIVAKAMEKDPARRYPSADDLAGDLVRYLEGEPISAAPPSGFYRLRRRMKKNPWLYAVGALGIAAVIVTGSILGSMWWKARGREAETARALDLWSKIAGIMGDAEVYARAGDVKRSRERLDEGIKICREHLGRGDSAHARYFLGRLLHERGDRVRALAELDRALQLDAGLGEARIVRGLLRVEEYGYKRRLYEQSRYASSLEVGATTPLSTDEIERLYPDLREIRRRAVEDLSASVESSAFIKEADATFGKAELLRLRGELREAERLYSGIIAREPLHVRSLLALATLAEDRGDKTEADRLLAEAERVHRGFGLTYLTRSAATVSRARAVTEITERETLLRQGLHDAQTAIEIDDSTNFAYALRACAADELGLLEDDRGGTADAWFERAVSDYSRALQLEPQNAAYLDARGTVLKQWGVSLADRGKDPRPAFSRATKDFQEALRINPNLPNPWNNFGTLYRSVAEADHARGQDPRPPLAEAVRCFERALEIEPTFAQAWDNRGSAFSMKADADFERGADARGSFLKAVESFDSAIKSMPIYSSAYNNRGNAYGGLAKIEQARGDDPRPSLSQAIASYSSAIDINPVYFLAYANRAVALLERSEEDQARGQHPWADITKAEQDLKESVRLKPNYVNSYNTLGSLYVRMAEFQTASNVDPGPRLQQAIETFGQAIRINGNFAPAFVNRGRAYHMLAIALDGRNEDPREMLQRAIADYAAAVERNPSDLTAHVNVCLSLCVLALADAQRGQDPLDPLRRAMEEGKKAVGLNPSSAVAHLNLGIAFFHAAQAVNEKGEDPGPYCRDSLNHLERAVELNPKLGAGVESKLQRLRTVLKEEF